MGLVSVHILREFLWAKGQEQPFALEGICRGVKRPECRGSWVLASERGEGFLEGMIAAQSRMSKGSLKESVT